MIHGRGIFAAALAMTAAGCAASTPSTPSMPAATAPGTTIAADSTGRFEDFGSILVFAGEADGNIEPIRAIRGPNTGLRMPQAVAIDQHGFVYAANFQRSLASDDTVRVFGPDADGDVIPSRILAGPHTRLARPVTLAFDRQDRLYVANLAMSQGSDSNGVVVYDPGPAGDATPRTTLVGASIADGMTMPTRIAFGRGDSIYVKWAGPLSIYAPLATGASEPRRTVIWYTKGPQFRTSHAPRVFVLDPHDTRTSIVRGQRTGDSPRVDPFRSR